MTTRNLFAALAGLTVAGALALTGCTAGSETPVEPGESAQGGTEDAAAFLACLTAAGVEAKITDSGQVAVKAGAGSAEGGAVSSGDGLLGMEGDDEGNTWVIPVDSAYFAGDAVTQDAYAACEAEHPDFEQPQIVPGEDPAEQEQQAEQEEAALAFAQCARANGYAQFEDPDFSRANALQIPADLTEAEFRAVLEECWDRDAAVFNLGQPLDAPFEAWAVLEEFLGTPAS
ncbi:hypothetical protein [Nocardioides sp.]|uniref:hypothetical protein n=1 Tax=Nocardioides sp. TaxID=35761 RepID=UPI0039E47A11